MGNDTLDYKLGVIDTKLDQLIATSDTRDRRVGHMERRIVVLENARWKLIGMVAGASAVVSIVVAFIVKH